MHCADVGCAAVAGAQMLYYLHDLWNIPATMYESGVCHGDISAYEFVFQDLTVDAWRKMAWKKADHRMEYDRRISTEYSAILMGFVGESLGMRYSENNGSTAGTADMKRLFGSYGFQYTYGDYKAQSVLQSLDRKIPVVIFGNSQEGGGHSWLIDGYQKCFKQIVLTYRWYTRYTKDIDPGDIEVTRPGTEPGTGDITDPGYEGGTAVADSTLIVIGKRGRSGFTEPDKSRYWTNKTKEVISASVPDGQFLHMNWGAEDGRKYYANWYATGDAWEIAGDIYGGMRKTLIITGHN